VAVAFIAFSLILFIRWVKLNQIQTSNGPNPCPPTVSKMIDGRSSRAHVQPSQILDLFDCEAPRLTILPSLSKTEFPLRLVIPGQVVPLTTNASLRSPPMAPA